LMHEIIDHTMLFLPLTKLLIFSSKNQVRTQCMRTPTRFGRRGNIARSDVTWIHPMMMYVIYSLIAFSFDNN